MREIKFRGKSKQTGKWVYGYYFKDFNGKSYIINTIQEIQNADISNVWIEVLEETVGQYTGLKDKNGKEIYEGDIITGTDYPFIDEEKQNYVGIVVFYDDAASFGYEYQCVRKDKRGVSNGINNEFEANENLVCDDLEVIGNIYDNPEMLGGNNED